MQMMLFHLSDSLRFGDANLSRDLLEKRVSAVTYHIRDWNTVCSMMNVYIRFTDCGHVIVLMCPVQPAAFQSRSKSSIFSLLQCRKHKDYSIFSLLFIIFS